MAYSKAKLKSSCVRASPCFRPFVIGNLSDTFLPTRNLLNISGRLIFIKLKSFLGIPNSMTILYMASVLTESKAFLKSMKSWRTSSFYFHFFSSIWRMHCIWSIVDLLRRKPHWLLSIMFLTLYLDLQNNVLPDLFCIIRAVRWYILILKILPTYILIYLLIYLLTYFLTYLLTYVLHGAQSFFWI